MKKKPKVLRKELEKQTAVLKKKNWPLKWKELEKQVSTMHKFKYWRRSVEVDGARSDYFLYYEKPPRADYSKGEILGWTKSVILSHEKRNSLDPLSADSSADFSWHSDLGHSFGEASGIKWTRISKDVFDFWWNIATSNPKPDFSV